MTLDLQVTEEEELGETTRIVVTVPDGFEAKGCRATGWDCAPDPPRHLVFTRNPFALFNSGFELDVHTATINGTYAFRVTQSNAGGAEKPFFPAVTVVGGQDPPREPAPPPSPEPSPTANSSGSGDTTDTTDSTDSTSDDPASGDDASDGTSDATSNSSSGGSTAPRRTQGRSNGTSLEIVPGEPTDRGQADMADVANPDVAPSGGTGSDAEAAATVAAGDDPASRDGSGGMPWQQWVGGALLLAGAAVVGVRRWLAS